MGFNFGTMRAGALVLVIGLLVSVTGPAVTANAQSTGSTIAEVMRNRGDMTQLLEMMRRANLLGALESPQSRISVFGFTDQELAKVIDGDTAALASFMSNRAVLTQCMRMIIVPHAIPKNGLYERAYNLPTIGQKTIRTQPNQSRDEVFAEGFTITDVFGPVENGFLYITEDPVFFQEDAQGRGRLTC